MTPLTSAYQSRRLLATQRLRFAFARRDELVWLSATKPSLRSFCTKQNANPLVSTTTSNVGRFAGAIAGRIRERSSCHVDAIGPAALYNAVKSIVIAGTYLNESHAGQCLAAFPEKINVADNHTEDNRVSKAWRVKVALIKSTVEELSDPALYVARDTNTGLLAGLVAKGLKERGQTDLGAMGAPAISNAFKALLITRTYMKEDLDLQKETIVATARSNAFKISSGEERSRIILSCIRVPTSTLEDKAPSE
mmetsp:Transcript_82263/g.129523  ORF Transcript_82263/g.129523 Transcript_82263/m.129523 type:complete len:251 (+) Transcript_82263:64-816(+)|eukprot:CAMPEP_0169122994 /NCGR_PEP_ID=MMETSP1015-20121227/33546_1 /TAXON_ID=342587 /ORGANISM="Karlodinium micrum, Strain CCMP2283" /LENGTH=250 /DNA_ID=CAMNT_0009186297 /DNA_START=13 /DNA_END=765 /DNA_ORIENTATION=-